MSTTGITVKKFRELRKQINLTQEQFAKLAMMDHRTLSRCEKFDNPEKILSLSANQLEILNSLDAKIQTTSEPSELGRRIKAAIKEGFLPAIRIILETTEDEWKNFSLQDVKIIKYDKSQLDILQIVRKKVWANGWLESFGIQSIEQLGRLYAEQDGFFFLLASFKGQQNIGYALSYCIQNTTQLNLGTEVVASEMVIKKFDRLFDGGKTIAFWNGVGVIPQARGKGIIGKIGRQLITQTLEQKNIKTVFFYTENIVEFKLPISTLQALGFKLFEDDKGIVVKDPLDEGLKDKKGREIYKKYWICDVKTLSEQYFTLCKRGLL